MTESSAYVVVPGVDSQYHFCGVISIQHIVSASTDGTEGGGEALMGLRRNGGDKLFRSTFV